MRSCQQIASYFDIDSIDTKRINVMKTTATDAGKARSSTVNAYVSEIDGLAVVPNNKTVYRWHTACTSW